MKSIGVVALVVLTLLSTAFGAANDREHQKIAFLISSVENLKDAQFIRNGSAYDGKRAADHLRLKLQQAGDQVQRADDFIRLCASKSSVTGKPYLIRLPDGKTVAADEFFRKKLKEYDPPVK
ncbi:MAG: DUF5329 family protein [Deltaproteobacteria bacterium]|nr:DUF5329 family protein [Deltaproteobacteria bacterium]